MDFCKFNTSLVFISSSMLHGETLSGGGGGRGEKKRKEKKKIKISHDKK